VAFRPCCGRSVTVTHQGELQGCTRGCGRDAVGDAQQSGPPGRCQHVAALARRSGRNERSAVWIGSGRSVGVGSPSRRHASNLTAASKATNRAAAAAGQGETVRRASCGYRAEALFSRTLVLA
jgi:hypothetical protein